MSKNIEWSFNQLEKVSRTFSIPIQMLDKNDSIYTCTGYLMCRISDTIEDSPLLSLEQKRELFQEYRNVINKPYDNNINHFTNLSSRYIPDSPVEPKSHWDLLLNLDKVIEVYNSFDEQIQNALYNPVMEMINGMEDFCIKYNGHMRIKTFSELEEYCYYVAGTVGNMLTNINLMQHDIDNEDELYNDARQYGLMLQLVNISKDVYDDYNSENNIYIPKDILNKYNIPQNNLLDDEYIKNTEMALNEVIEETSNKVKHARKYLKNISQLDKGCMSAWSIPYLLSVSTLRELKDNSEKSLREGGVKMDRNEVYAIINEINKETTYEDLLDIERKVEENPYHNF